MKKIFTLSILFLVLSFFAITVEASTKRVRGYIKPSTGTYVAPHYKTSPNKSKFDNFSSKGNYNPYTGKSGTVDPFKYKSKYRY